MKALWEPDRIGLKHLGILALAFVLLASPLLSEAQEAKKVYRVGHLMLLPREPLTPFIEALEQGLRDLGYVEGRNVIIEHRSAEGNLERLPDVAAELVRLKVDVIVTGINPAIAAAKQATTTIPIVMVYGADPVGMGFIASLRRPGGNVTGGSRDVSPEIYAKHLELLREVAPRVSRVAFLWHHAFPGAAPYVKAVEDAARRSGVRFQSVKVQGPNEFESAFASLAKEPATGLLVLTEAFMFSRRRDIAELAARNRLPAIYHSSEWVNAGGLMSYGPNLNEFWRRAAVYIDRILKGANPADLPVEQPDTFELVINLKAAKALGLAIPPSILLRADRVLE